MESERRSTMSSLKGQLSNVEGSVKSMKAAVVVGSVLTVACLAAVFGVTILANEVSKEVKVSNGTLSTKNGQAVLTTTTYTSNKASGLAESVVADFGSFNGVFAVNAVVTQGTTVTTICDDIVVIGEEVLIREGSFLDSEDSLELRSLNQDYGKKCKRKPSMRKCVMAVVQWLVKKGAAWAREWLKENQ
ncbi:hypothetical protein HOP50_13g68500 [Chloropicon primus]|uniref:Uncharacterized protein n=1 Tax=Chloropicon primus TaxID=1764295 RepID=A0A5B8MUR4_9CHLO|nr:hypothetical protein A3770_13p68310 [Chloropicon primus]UPR03521.1 hypothetical protein HOP50_13g68500 [Chloropicon primus]|eukprot:QDZ24313.1 hypothetical protein A3770_13p68310 [Chloropicon primus]